MSWASRHNLLAKAVNRNLGGVSVLWGAVSGLALFEQNADVVLNGEAISVEYALHNLPTATFGNMLYGDEITVSGVTYQVRELMRLGDGQYCMASLSRLDPGTSAPGADPRSGLALDDLTDVELINPTAGEVLKYDGTQWVDGTDEGGAYVFTQAAAASTWTINHNLGHVPSVEVFDSGSQEVEADVTHPSVNQTIILFTVSISGFARLI